MICDVTNCVTCNSVNFCSICAAGYYNTTAGTCLPNCNITNCQVCSMPNQCQNCTAGYDMANATSCVIKSCATGLIYDGLQCVCPKGKVLNNSICVDCSLNCI